MKRFNIYLNDGKSDNSEFLSFAVLSSAEDLEYIFGVDLEECERRNDLDELTGVYYVVQADAKEMLNKLKIDTEKLENSYPENYEDCYIFIEEDE